MQTAVTQDSRLCPTNQALRNLFINLTPGEAQRALNCANAAYTPEARASFLSALANCELDGLMRHPEVQRWALGALVARDINLSQYATLIAFSTPFRSALNQIVRVTYHNKSEDCQPGGTEKTAAAMGLIDREIEMLKLQAERLPTWERSIMTVEVANSVETEAGPKKVFEAIKEAHWLLNKLHGQMFSCPPPYQTARANLPSISMFQLALNIRYPDSAPKIWPEVGMCSRTRYAVHARTGRGPISLGVDDITINTKIHSFAPDVFIMTLHDYYHAFRRAPIPTFMRMAAMRIHDILIKLETEIKIEARSGGECVVPVKGALFDGCHFLEIRQHHLTNTQSLKISDLMIDLEFDIDDAWPLTAERPRAVAQLITLACDATRSGPMSEQVPLIAIILDLAKNPKYWREKVGIEPSDLVASIGSVLGHSWPGNLYRANLQQSVKIPAGPLRSIHSGICLFT